MLHVNFNSYNNYVTDSLYQWDLNRDLAIYGLGLSVVPEIHFSNANMDRAIVRQATLEGGVVTVSIPNSLLQTALTIKAYVGVYEGEAFKVIETIEIPVIAKVKPMDYAIEDSDEEIYSFKALEYKLERAKEDLIAEAAEVSKGLNARVSNIIANNNNTDGNSELVDLRVDYKGNTHESAGDAIRAQFTEILERADFTQASKYYDELSEMSETLSEKHTELSAKLDELEEDFNESDVTQVTEVVNSFKDEFNEKVSALDKRIQNITNGYDTYPFETVYGENSITVPSNALSYAEITNTSGGVKTITSYQIMPGMDIKLAIDTITIPDEVTSIAGYENGSIDFATGMLVMDAGNTVIDIREYISYDNFIKVFPGGVIEFDGKASITFMKKG